MAKISHGAHSWRSEGLAKKYKEQEKIAFDIPSRHKAKKNTRKWCRGKVGVSHTLERYFWRYGWESKRTNWIRTRCVECGKEFYNKDSSIPLRIELDESDGIRYPVQVKLNGRAIPFDRQTIEHINSNYSGWWCEQCHEWHR